MYKDIYLGLVCFSFIYKINKTGSVLYIQSKGHGFKLRFEWLFSLEGEEILPLFSVESDQLLLKEWISTGCTLNNMARISSYHYQLSDIEMSLNPTKNR